MASNKDFSISTFRSLFPLPDDREPDHVPEVFTLVQASAAHLRHAAAGVVQEPEEQPRSL